MGAGPVFKPRNPVATLTITGGGKRTSQVRNASKAPFSLSISSERPAVMARSKAIISSGTAHAAEEVVPGREVSGAAGPRLDRAYVKRASLPTKSRNWYR